MDLNAISSQLESSVMNAFKDTRSSALTLGVGTVVATHSMMLLLPPDWQETQMKNHAMINLVAAAAIVWGARILG